uniref:Unkown protein n=1 Tax=Riptortus pedestris TaxID=329032 RepID=R4WE51_RIPPE|nr:unkown protein [Riptortus pedestris]
MKRSELLRNLLDKWPGKQWFGIYRFMPLFFLLGAGLEYTMINWDFKERVNFYRTYKRRQAEILAEERIASGSV